MKTLTEKYRGVLNESFSKKQFVRDARIAHPSLITPINSFADTVKILKNKGHISEEAPKMYGKYELENIKAEDKFSAETIQRGIDAELEAMGLSSHESVSKEDYGKAKEKAIKNLEKDQNHYLNLMSGESSKVDKHDQMVQADKKNNVDVFNGMKKADLKEGAEEKRELPKSIADKEKDQIEKDAMKAKGMIKEDPKENIIAVAKVIRAKYGQIPGFTPLLKDFLFTHQHEIKAGEVGPEDAIAEFDNYIDANYDRLDEKEVNERVGGLDEFISLIEDRAADSGFEPKEEAAEVIENLMDHYNLKPNDVKGIFGELGINEANIQGDQITFFDALDKFSIRDIMDAAVKYLGKQSGGDMDDYTLARKMAAVDKDAWGDTRFREGKGKDHDGDGDIDGDDYMAAKDKAIKKAMGKEEQLKEAVKNIIKKTLEEGVINEAATQELARLADTYGEFEGFKQSIIQLQDVVTDIESYYDKTRAKIQKVYDSIGDIRNEEGLKVGAFLAPSIESAFNKDLRPVTKSGFTKGLDTPKVKMISKAQVDAAQGMDEEPKQTLFTPVNENKK